jgi:hypothetical protein
VLAQAVMEAEVTELTGVPKGERDPERGLTSRNRYRDWRWDTWVGTVNRPAHATPERDDSDYPAVRERPGRPLLLLPPGSRANGGGLSPGG